MEITRRGPSPAPLVLFESPGLRPLAPFGGGRNVLGRTCQAGREGDGRIYKAYDRLSGIKFAEITPGLFPVRGFSQKGTFLNLKGDHDGKKENFGQSSAGHIFPGASLFFPLGIFGFNL